jgi:hypothetical protein
VQARIIDLALEVPELSPRELAVRFTDQESYFRFRGFGLSPTQIPRSDPKSGFHPDQGRPGIPYQDHGAQPAMADGFHL